VSEVMAYGNNTADISIVAWYKSTKKRVKTNPKAKSSITLVEILGLFFLMTAGFAWTDLNFYFFSLLALKMYIIIAILMMALATFADSRDIFQAWRSYEARERLVKGKILFTFIESIKILAICFIVLAFLHISGIISYWEKNKEKFSHIIVSHYQPNIIEALIFVLIWVLSIIVLICAMLWFCARFIQIKGYSIETNLLKLKGSKIIIGGFIIGIIFWGLLGFIDLSFIEVKTGGHFAGSEYLQSLMASLEPWLLPIESFFLAILSILFWFDGVRMLRKRNDFVVV